MTMNTAAWCWFAATCLAVLLASLWLWSWWRARAETKAEAKRADRWEERYNALANIATEQDHYEIRISDWGPEYTGRDGTLPRYRWVVEDPLYWIKVSTGAGKTGANAWLMLGNSHTPEQALQEAYRWIEQQRIPARIIEGEGPGEGPDHRQ